MSAIVVRTAELLTSWTSGASSFAIVRTRVNVRVSVPDGGTVPVAAPSNANGTSTPGVFSPSERRYSTWYRVMVTALLVVGALGVAGLPTSFSERLRMTCPGSPKIVGHGFARLQTPPDVTSVRTSELSVPVKVAGLLPGAAPSWLTTRYTGERLSRAALPQEVAAMIAAASPISLMV